MLYTPKYSLPTPPFVDVEGVLNFRDVGGYPIVDPNHYGPPRSVRRGLVFRSAEPTRLTATGMHKLQSLGVNTVFDLRSAAEAMKDVKAIIETDGSSLERVSVPIFADDEDSGDESPTRKRSRAQQAQIDRCVVKKSSAYRRCAEHMQSGAEGFSNAYREIVAHAGPALRTILIHLKDQPDDPITLHCSLGRDRTGVIIAILLSLLGVPDWVIAREYQLTEVGLGPMREEIVKDVLGREESPNSKMKRVECLMGARQENVEKMLVMLREEYGGADEYIKKECGLSQWDLEAIKSALVVNVAPIHYSRSPSPE